MKLWTMCSSAATLLAKLAFDAPMFKWICATIGAGVFYVLPNDKLQGTALATFTLILVDTITGVWGAFRLGIPISSNRFGNVLSKLIGYGSVLIVCAIVTREVPGMTQLTAAGVGSAMILIICTEAVSILENARKIGVQLPFGLEEVILRRLKEQAKKAGGRRSYDPPHRITQSARKPDNGERRRRDDC